MGLITCNDVCKSFGDKVALDHVSVDIPKGKIFGLLGPNGAGKTTLIRIINRITIPNGGSVLFDGRPITQDDVEKIGYLPEERGLYRKMKVGEQAMYFAQLKGMSAREAGAELKKWFVRFGIESWWNKKVEELSKGMAQKVQFITTVVHKPSLLILDEPFSGFDPVNAQVIREEILRLKDDGATIILSTHNMESVEELCDNIALINKSRMVITGGVDEIRHKYGNNNVEVVYTSPDTIVSVPDVFDVLSDINDSGRHTAVLSLDQRAERNAPLAHVLGQGLTVNSYKELVPRMNDIFIKLVTEEEQAMKFRNVGIVISREYLTRVKKKSFLVTTFLVPVIFAAICILPSIIMLFAKDTGKSIAVVDQSGIVMPYLTDTEEADYTDYSAENPDTLKSRFKELSLDAIVVISPVDTVARTVSVTSFSDKPMSVGLKESIKSKVDDAVEDYRVTLYQIDDLKQIMGDIKSDVSMSTYTLDESGEEKITSSEVYMVISMVLSMIIYMFIAMFTGMVMQSVIEEKASRVVEVLVSSVKATELMFGKIIGVACVALTQFFLWIVLTVLLVGGVSAFVGMDTLMGDPAQTEQMMEM